MTMALPFIAAAAGMAGGMLLSSAMSVPPLQRALSYTTNDWFPNMKPAIRDAIELRFRGEIDAEEFNKLCRHEGLASGYAGRMYRLSFQLMGVSELLTLYRRGHIPYAEYLDGMAKLKFSKYQAEQLLKVSEYFPSPADLVTFAVREVYTPEIVAKYGMDEDLPEKFLSEGAKAGLPEEQARNYWRAHWELPGATSGFEMLHRGVITEEELHTLLRTLDIMPFWREKLTQIAYSPYTRVDVRRMYGAGVLDREAVYRSYLDLGYAPEKAGKMTEFTVADAEQESRSITQAQILKGLEQGELSHAETVAMLGVIGYEPDSAEYIVALKENDLADKEQTVLVDTLKAQFKNQAITEEEFRNELDRLNLKASYRDKLIAQTIKEQSTTVTLPSRTDLERWLSMGIIEVPDYLDGMTQLGYRKNDIPRYLMGMRKLPSITELRKWLLSDLIDYPTWLLYMSALKFSADDIARFYSQLLGEKEKAQAKETIGE